MNLDALSQSWVLSLRADRKSPQTIKTYSDGVRFYLAWCTADGLDPLARVSLRAWVAGLLDSGGRGDGPLPSARRAPVRRLARRRG